MNHVDNSSSGSNALHNQTLAAQQQYSQRLDRIEEKLDRISDFLMQVVRLEEKVLASTSRIDSIEKRVVHLEDQHDQIKEALSTNSSIIKNAERIAWLLLSTGLSSLAYSFNVLAG